VIDGAAFARPPAGRAEHIVAKRTSSRAGSGKGASTKKKTSSAKRTTQKKKAKAARAGGTSTRSSTRSKKAPAKKAASKKKTSKKKAPAAKKAAAQKASTRKKAAGTKKSAVSKKSTTKKKATTVKKRVSRSKATSKKKATTAKKSSTRKPTTRKKTSQAKSASGKKPATVKKSSTDKASAGKKSRAAGGGGDAGAASSRQSTNGAVASSVGPDRFRGAFASDRKSSKSAAAALLKSAGLQGIKRAAAEAQAEQEYERLTKSPFNKRQLDRFRELLLAKRAEIFGDVENMENEALRRGESGSLSHTPQHMADAGSDTYDQSLNLDLAAGQRRFIKEIDDALDRIEKRTFGICEHLGKPISEERLEHTPWARYSIEGARDLERRGYDV